MDTGWLLPAVASVMVPPPPLPPVTGNDTVPLTVPPVTVLLVGQRGQTPLPASGLVASVMHTLVLCIKGVNLVAMNLTLQYRMTTIVVKLV